MTDFTSKASDHFHDECGVFGMWGHEDAAAHVALGLHALQHRGQEAAGIVSHNGSQFFSHRAMGLVGDQFSSQDVIGELVGEAAIGHNRYSTSGDTFMRNVQPLFADFSFGGLAIAHNGNLTNAYTLRRELIEKGAIFQSTSDTEIIIHLVAHSSATTIQDRLIDAFSQIEGAFSVIALCHEGMFGMRDSRGVRPLVMGTLNGAPILASESCALDIIGAEHLRDIEPGELVHISADGVKSMKPLAPKDSRFCIFEYVYFARPDSVFDGQNVYDSRKEIGAQLAKESAVGADVIVPVPDSGVPAAIGYAQESGVPFDLGIIRNHYVGRTFIEPTDQVRNLGVKLKHNANSAMLKGKRVVLVDDSIVRGTTSKKIVAMVREAGAAEVHMRIASPPTMHACYYGVDTPESEKLLAFNYSVEEMAKLIGADSLAFISLDGLYRAVGEANGKDNENPLYCDACFSGDYPIALTDKDAGMNAHQKDLFSGMERLVK